MLEQVLIKIELYYPVCKCSAHLPHVIKPALNLNGCRTAGAGHIDKMIKAFASESKRKPGKTAA